MAKLWPLKETHFLKFHFLFHLLMIYIVFSRSAQPSEKTNNYASIFYCCMRKLNITSKKILEKFSMKINSFFSDRENKALKFEKVKLAREFLIF